MPGARDEPRWRGRIVALLLLCVAVGWFLRGDGGNVAPPPTHDVASSARPPAVLEATRAANPNDGATRTDRDAAAPEPELPSEPDGEGVGTFRGRCVAAEDGRPLAGCEVKATSKHVTVTAADGTFVVGHPPGWSDLTISGPQRARRLIRPGPVVAGTTYELGDVTLARGFPITGRVVDANGAPVADLGVYVLGLGVGPDGRHESTGAEGGSGADGSFTLAPLLAAGRWNVRVMGARLQGDSDFVVDAATGAPPLLLVVAPALQVRTIRGVVVDDVGEPVDGVLLDARVAGSMAQSKADGTFSIAARPARDDDELVVRVPARCDTDPTPRPVRWGSDDVRIVLRRAAALTVDVVDDAGTPVTGFGVSLTSEPQLVQGEERSRGHATHENGRAVIAPARRGRAVLRVFPHDVDLLPSQPVELTVVDAMPPVRVVVERARQCLVEVVGARGEPVANATVELVRMHAPLEQSFGEALVPGKRGATTLWYRQSRQPERIDRATTDAAGHTTLLVPRDLQGTLLRCDMPPFAPFHRVAPALRPGVPLRIELAASGAIAGKVVLDGTPPASVRVELRGVGANVRAIDQSFVELAADGSFRFDRLAAGPWSVLANTHVVWAADASTTTATVPLPATARTVAVVAGQTVHVEITGVPRATGSLRGVVRCDARDLRGWTADLVRSDANARHGPFVLAADGSFEATKLLPGRMRLALRRAGASSGELGAVLAEEIDVLPDAHIVREFSFVPRRAVIELRNPDGSPFAGRFGLRCGLEIDWSESGARSVLDPAPELPIAFRADDGEWSEPVTVPRDQREFAATVVVPARR